MKIKAVKQNAPAQRLKEIPQEPKELRRVKGPVKTPVHLQALDRLGTIIRKRLHDATTGMGTMPEEESLSHAERAVLQKVKEDPENAESHLIQHLIRSPETTRTSSVNPLVSRLRGEKGGISDITRLASLYPEEAQRESQRVAIQQRTGRTSASPQRSLDDWSNAQSTRDLIGTSLPDNPKRKRNRSADQLRRRNGSKKAEPQEGALSLAKSVQSLCSTLFGGDNNKSNAFLDAVSSAFGTLFDGESPNVDGIPILPFGMNVIASGFGRAFPRFSQLGTELSSYLGTVLREISTEDKKQGQAVFGLRLLSGDVMTPGDLAAWYSMMNLGLAFYEFCVRVGTEALTSIRRGQQQANNESPHEIADSEWPF